MSNVNLKELFSAMQHNMSSSLEMDRAVIPHNVEKGSATENNWKKWFNKYLPKRYCVDKAFIVDSNSEISEQIDLVVYDAQYSYFIFNHNGALYIPAESVYAVFEVKQKLNKEHLVYAGGKAMSVRRLFRTSIEIPSAGGKLSPKPLHAILAGILTADSTWKDPLGKTFSNNLHEITGDSSLDIGCVISAGAFSMDMIDDRLELVQSTKEDALMFFFLKLLMKLQAIGTVPAIDITQYAKVLDSF